jgi:hypothetical protein
MGDNGDTYALKLHIALYELQGCPPANKLSQAARPEDYETRISNSCTKPSSGYILCKLLSRVLVALAGVGLSCDRYIANESSP